MLITNYHKLLLSALCVLVSPEIAASKSRKDDCCGSHTIFVPRPLTTDLTLELALTNYQLYHPSICSDIPTCFNAQVSYFHQESTRGCKFGRNFLPNNKSCALVAEDGSGDVGSLWLELISAPGTSFKSTFCIAPKRRVDGGYFNFHFDLSRWLCGVWFSVSFAAARVEHKLNICETTGDAEGTLEGIPNVTAALNNPTWNAGRFSTCKLCRTGVDDVQFKVGYDYFFCDGHHTGLYFVGTAPTGRRCDSQFIFYPRLGSRQGSVGIGINTDVIAWCCGNQRVNWMLDANYRHVFSDCERRSFDLCGRGDWSRFLQVVTPEERSFSRSGINFFTHDVKVKPRNTVQLWTALHYACCAYNFELGYNLWWRDCERVCLISNQCPVGIFDITGDCNRNPVSASQANITQSVVGNNRAPSDNSFVPLTNADLNLASGSAPRALTNKIYAALSYNNIVRCTPVLVGFGGAYEFSSRCKAVPDHWSIFVKTAIIF